MHERLNMLMEGVTKDLTHNSEFICKADEIIRKLEGPQILHDHNTSKEDIVRCIGVKRTNANDLSSINLDNGVALYPTYPLMNSHCYCNTR
jgi:hypothetical protein